MAALTPIRSACAALVSQGQGEPGEKIGLSEGQADCQKRGEKLGFTAHAGI